MPRVIKGQVKCQYWDRPEPFEIVVPDDATEEEIEHELRDAAADAAGLDFWRDDE